MIFPDRVNTKRSFFSIAEVNPGYTPHRWHTHVSDRGESYEVTYDEDFEEFYYIVSGKGIIQWEEKSETVKEVEVSAGDTIFMPAVVPEHQLFNNDNEKILMIGAGGPPPEVKIKE